MVSKVTSLFAPGAVAETAATVPALITFAAVYHLRSTRVLVDSNVTDS